MAERNPFASGVILHLKLFRILFEGGPLMLKEFIGVELPLKTNKQWNEGRLWNEWCIENRTYLKQFRFYSNQKKIHFDGQMIPDLDNADITFFKHALKRFTDKRNYAEVEKLSKKRNEVAHRNVKSMDSLEFVTWFAEVVEIFKSLLQDHEELKAKWLGYLRDRLEEEVCNVEELEARCRDQQKLYLEDESGFAKKWNEIPMMPSNQPPSRSSSRKRQVIKGIREIAKVFQEEMKHNKKIFYVPGTKQQLLLSEDYINVRLVNVLDDSESSEAGEKSIYDSSEISSLESSDESGKEAAEECSTRHQIPVGNTQSQNISKNNIEIEYDLESDEEQDDMESKICDYYYFEELMEEFERNSKILITANGGCGKTMLSNYIVWKWANGENLEDYLMVFPLDVQLIDFHEDLFVNLLTQYPFFERYTDLQKSLEENAEKILWIFDGLDFCSSQSAAYDFFEKNLSPSEFGSSSFLFLTRPSGNGLLEKIDSDLLKLQIAPLTQEQSFRFVDDFGSSRETVREANRRKIESSRAIIFLLKLPMILVMLCGMFQEKNYDDDLEVYQEVFNRAAKREMMKSLEHKRRISKSVEERDKLYREMNTVQQVDTERSRWLNAIIKIVWRCHFILEVDKFYQELENSLEPQGVEVISRLNFISLNGNKTKSTTKLICPHFLEYISGKFLAINNLDALASSFGLKMEMKRVDILRCASNVYLSNTFSVDSAVSGFKKFFQFILGSSQAFSEYNFFQIIAVIVRIALQKPRFVSMALKTIHKIRILGESKFPSEDFSYLEENLSLEFFNELRFHRQKNVCSHCILPSGLNEKLNLLHEAFIEEINEQSLSNISYICDKFLFFCFPMDDEKDMSKHIGENSDYILMLSQKHYNSGSDYSLSSAVNSVEYPLEIEAPTLRADDRESIKHFAVGLGFLAVSFKGKIYVWGERQALPNGDVQDLPHDVFVMDPDDFLWNQIKATGDIPSSTLSADGVAIKNAIYLVNQFSEQKYQLLSLDSRGRFTLKVPNLMESLSGSYTNRFVEYLGNLFLLFNYQHLELIEYDPKSNALFVRPSSGFSPTARRDFAIARLREKLFIHGGREGEDSFGEFFFLNLETMTWNEIKKFGFGRPFFFHSLTPISATNLLVVGGITKRFKSIRDDVKVFDTEKMSWIREPRLSTEFCGEGGLMQHRAVAVRKCNRVVSVFCFGGNIDKECKEHPRHFLKFNVC